MSVKTGHAHICPYGPYLVAHGATVNIGVHSPSQWRAFCVRVLGRPELVEDPRYRTNELRIANRTTLEAVVIERLRTIEAADLIQALEDADIPCGVINDVAGLAGHVQLSSRGRWLEVGSPSEPIRALVPPFNLSGVTRPAGDVPRSGSTR